MISFLLNALSIFFVFTVVIVLHELGHFFMAKKAGVKVHTFTLGLGPELFGFNFKGTRFCFCAFPIGGSVNMEGMLGSNRKDSFYVQPWYNRFLIAFAGPAMNFILSFVVFTCLVFANNIEFAKKYGSTVLIGRSAISSVNICIDMTKETGKFLLHPRLKIDGHQALSGPVGISKSIATTRETNGMTGIWIMIGVISLSLGLMNLLPLPILDGGFMLIAVVEATLRRRLNTKVYQYMSLLTWSLLLSIMLYVTYIDIFGM